MSHSKDITICDGIEVKFTAKIFTFDDQKCIFLNPAEGLKQ